jgi:hypothetical protein
MVRRILAPFALIALLLSAACSHDYDVGNDADASQPQVNSNGSQQRGPDNASTDNGDGRRDSY